MTDKTAIAPPTVDGTQEVRGNLDGTQGSHFGNEGDRHDPRSPDQVRVGHADGGTRADPIAATHAPGQDISDDAGRRAYVDQRTGEVHGSGADAGGGVGVEDYDSDPPSGSGEAPQQEATPDRLPPAR